MHVVHGARFRQKRVRPRMVVVLQCGGADSGEVDEEMKAMRRIEFMSNR